MRFSNVLFSTLVALPFSYAQQAADGLIVPFTSSLPACASQCGPLYDVQGRCTPPNIATTDTTCFCTDNRLIAIGGDGTSGVSSVCGAAACTSATDLQSVKTWYTNFCRDKQTGPSTTTTSGTGTPKPTSTSGSGNSGNSSGSEEENQTWIQGHWQWVIMIVIVVIAIIVIWVGAWLLRKRYLRKKEREFEMRPPVAWGPNTMSGANGDGARAGGHHKEAATSAAPMNGKRLSKQKMGWFKPTTRG